MHLVTYRSKGRLQNFCESTEHCLIAFDDISSYKRIRGGIGWLAIGGNPFFPCILCMCHAKIDVVSADKFTTYLELL